MSVEWRKSMTDGPVLTAADPEPPPWTIVRDDTGCQWVRQPGRVPCGWISEHDTAAVDPESWTKVAGNYGPVTVLFTPPADADEVEPQRKPDIAEQIRARLDSRPALEAGECQRAGDVNQWISQAHAALIAVLETHKSWEVGDPDEPDYICQTCRYFTSEWPCPTVDDIATALGIEVDCG